MWQWVMEPGAYGLDRTICCTETAKIFIIILSNEMLYEHSGHYAPALHLHIPSSSISTEWTGMGPTTFLADVAVSVSTRLTMLDLGVGTRVQSDYTVHASQSVI